MMKSGQPRGRGDGLNHRKRQGAEGGPLPASPGQYPLRQAKVLRGWSGRFVDKILPE